MKRILTIIPTTCAPELAQAVESARHASDVLLVTDSVEGAARAADLLVSWPVGVAHLSLPFRVGGGEWGGHRIYAAVPHLVNHEFLAFLDEDNWYSPEHLPSLLDELTRGADAAWSYRTIHDRDGDLICDDRCESLGPDVIGVGGRRLVDTSCWAFRSTWMRRHCGPWDCGWGADARWTEKMRTSASRVAGTGLFSLCYRLGSSDRSPKPEFFLEGNRRMQERGQTALIQARPRP